MYFTRPEQAREALCNASADAGGDSDSAGSDSGSVGGDATYFVTCLTALAAGNMAKRLNFIATSDWNFRALTTSATRVDLAETVGSATKATERTNGQTTTLSFPTPFTIPATANSLSGREIVIESFALEATRSLR